MNRQLQEFVGLVALIAFITGVMFIGAANKELDIENQCEEKGRFIIDDNIYKCSAIEVIRESRK